MYDEDVAEAIERGTERIMKITGATPVGADPETRDSAQRAANAAGTDLRHARILLAETAERAGTLAQKELDQLDPAPMAEVRRRYQEGQEQKGQDCRDEGQTPFEHGMSALDMTEVLIHGAYAPPREFPVNMDPEDMTMGIRAAAHVKVSSSLKHAGGAGRSHAKRTKETERTHPFQNTTTCLAIARSITEAVLVTEALGRHEAALGNPGAVSGEQREHWQGPWQTPTGWRGAHARWPERKQNRRTGPKETESTGNDRSSGIPKEPGNPANSSPAPPSASGTP